MKSLLSIVAAFFAVLVVFNFVFDFVKQHNRKYIVGEDIEYEQ